MEVNFQFHGVAPPPPPPAGGFAFTFLEGGGFNLTIPANAGFTIGFIPAAAAAAAAVDAAGEEAAAAAVDPITCTILMVNRGPDTNDSQFMISMDKKRNWAYDIDTEHVVFGQVVEGLDVMRNIGMVAAKNYKPSKPVVIADCGQIL